jgi:hypothetical protein
MSFMVLRLCRNFNLAAMRFKLYIPTLASHVRPFFESHLTTWILPTSYAYLNLKMLKLTSGIFDVFYAFEEIAFLLVCDPRLTFDLFVPFHLLVRVRFWRPRREKKLNSKSKTSWLKIIFPFFRVKTPSKLFSVKSDCLNSNRKVELKL